MSAAKDFNYSYWELKSLFKQHDLVVIGSGIVGLSTAISFLEKNPIASVLVVEEGWQPDGASTKNAGFACFGSAGELLNDLKKMTSDTVWQTVQMRWNGLQMLRKRVGDHNLNYEELGGFELFFSKKEYDETRENLSILNKNVKEVLGLDNCYSEQPRDLNNFINCQGIIKNNFEGQLDTALMMQQLLQIACKKNARIINTVRVTELRDTTGVVEIETNIGVLRASRVVVATNGFASELLRINAVLPARAQVLVTTPIKNLAIKGAFHFDEGYYYFRNVDNRLLFGGGRNLDIEGETTTVRGLNSKIQDDLLKRLKENILHDTDFEIEARWSGIMGVGTEKKPIIRRHSENIIAAVRMGGMGVAIGTYVGEQAALLAL